MKPPKPKKSSKELAIDAVIEHARKTGQIKTPADEAELRAGLNRIAKPDPADVEKQHKEAIKKAEAKAKREAKKILREQEQALLDLSIRLGTVV